MRSVRAFFREEVERKRLTVSGDHIIISPEEEEKEFLRMKETNDQWNAECVKTREARLEKENARRREHILKRLELKETRDLLKQEKIEEIVRKEKVIQVSPHLKL